MCVLWIGLQRESDQLRATSFFRRYFNSSLARIFHTLRRETAEVAADQGLTKVRRMTVCWNTWKSTDEASP